MSRTRCPDFATILQQTNPTSKVRNQIAECFYAELKRSAVQRCNDMPSAEEALHNGLLTGLENLASWRNEGSLEAWLRRIVHTACTRLRRGMKNDPNINRPLPDGEGTLESNTVEIDAQAMMRQRLELLASELAHIPRENAELLILQEVEDVTLADLAKRFGLSVDGVKGRLKRTRALLRARLLIRAEELVDS